MAKSKRKAPAILVCQHSGREFEYRGHGRPPKYHPEVKKELDRQRRAEAYRAKQAAKGKTVKPRLAA